MINYWFTQIVLFVNIIICLGTFMIDNKQNSMHDMFRIFTT